MLQWWNYSETMVILVRDNGVQNGISWWICGPTDELPRSHPPDAAIHPCHLSLDHKVGLY